MTKKEFNCFRRLLKECYAMLDFYEPNLEFRDRQKKDLCNDINKFSDDLRELLGNPYSFSTPTINTIRNHLKIREKGNLPFRENLNIYCSYCLLKKSNWCKFKKWENLLENYSGSLYSDENIEYKDNNDSYNIFKPLQTPIIFQHVWYRSRPYKWCDFWRSPPEGVLTITMSDKIEFKSRKVNFHINNITNIIQDKMPGDMANSWCVIIYNDKDDNAKEAWFQEKPKHGGRGVSALTGGSEKLYLALNQFFKKEAE